MVSVFHVGKEAFCDTCYVTCDHWDTGILNVFIYLHRTRTTLTVTYVTKGTICLTYLKFVG
jgi:hypothetical protein